MQNTKGGYSILDLTSIILVSDDDSLIIKDKKVLNQLYEILLPYVLDDKKELKPIYIRFVDDIEEKNKHVIFATIKKFGVDTFKIYSSDEFNLSITIVFEQDEETLEWLITYCSYIYHSLLLTIQEDVLSLINEGTISETLGLNEDGELVKEVVESGTKLYKHEIETGGEILYIISTYNLPYEKTDFIGFSMGKKFISGYSNGESIGIVTLDYDDQSDKIQIVFTNGGDDVYDTTDFADTVTEL